MIEIHALTKRYGTFAALSDVTFTARPGVVTGFLGPNGAGKSTCMRVICGLTRADGGQALVLGRQYRDLPNPASRVGTLLDAGAQHPGRTGREVLTLGAIAVGAPRGRVDELLGLVGLDAGEATRRVGKYSLGMRQRLGIAHALLGDPQVLILDEPANGLDPQGIRWIRGLLRSLAGEGRTVLLSSHLLHEIELIADELVVIGSGRVVAQGAKSSLLHSSGTTVCTPQPEELIVALTGRGLQVSARDRNTFTVDADGEQIGRIALSAGVVVSRLQPAEGAGLEQLFIDLTEAHARDRQEVAA